MPAFEGCRRGLPPTRRNPPRNALALSPARQPGGSSFSFLTLPPQEPRRRVRGRRSGGPRRPRHRAATSSCRAFPVRAAHVVLVGAFLVREMAEFHGSTMPSTIMRSRAGSQAQEEHLPALVASEACMAASLISFTGRRMQLRNRSRPSPSEVVRFGNWPVLEDRPRVADRHHVILPVPGELLDSGDHLSRPSASARTETSAARSGPWRGS